MTPLVGRGDVLAYLDGVLARARDGAGGLVLVTGEPGIGKTRLADEVARTAGGFAVQWAWCTAERDAGALRSWASVLRGLAGRDAAVATSAQTSPVLHALLSGTGEAPEHGAALLSADLVATLVAAARTQPLLLVLDDLHDAQLSSLRVLTDLAGAARSAPLVVLATARDGAHEWTGREQLRGELLGQAHRLALGPLSRSDVATLLPDPGRADEVLTRTGGNPLLVTELAQATEDVPSSLTAIVAARTARLSPTAREVLSAAAVLGPRFRLDVLAEVTGAALGEGVYDGGLAVPDGAGRARFSHELLRDAVRDGLDPAQLQRLHAKAGQVLASLRARGRDVDAAEVAAHLLASGSDDAADAALDAARQAARMSAFDDAVRWYAEALPLLDKGSRAEVLLECARARRGTGDRDGARKDLLSAAASAPTPQLLALAALHLGTGLVGFEVDANDAEQVTLLEQALATLPEDELALRGAVLGRLALARGWVEEPDVLEAQAREAVALTRASGDPVALAGALAALCDCTAGPEHVDARLEHAAEIVALADDSAEIELLGRRLRVVALLELGDRSGAEQEMAAYGLRAQALRHPLYLWYVPLWQGFWALAQGRYDDQARHLAEVERLGAGSTDAFMLALTQTWCRISQLDDKEALAATLTPDLLDGFGPSPWVQVSYALGDLQQGKTEQAYARLEAVAPLLLGQRRDSEWLPEMAQVALLVAGREHWLRQPLYEALLPYADLQVIEGIGAATRGPVAGFLAMLAPDAQTAAAHRARAQELLRAFGATALLDDAPSPTAGPSWLLQGETWSVSWQGRTSLVRDSKGMRDLATLLSRQGTEVSALDLYGGDVIESDTGDVLDQQAVRAYKERLRRLEEQQSLSEAEAEERDFLLAQLSAALGLGGRSRRTGSSVEKARSAVTARVRDTVKRLAALDPDLGRHLTHAVRTGTFCSYSPEHAVEWRLTP